jgi:hypothetical protein
VLRQGLTRPLLLYVDDGPTDLAETILERPDLELALLRVRDGYRPPLSSGRRSTTRTSTRKGRR